MFIIFCDSSYSDITNRHIAPIFLPPYHAHLTSIIIYYRPRNARSCSHFPAHSVAAYSSFHQPLIFLSLFFLFLSVSLHAHSTARPCLPSFPLMTLTSTSDDVSCTLPLPDKFAVNYVNMERDRIRKGCAARMGLGCLCHMGVVLKVFSTLMRFNMIIVIIIYDFFDVMGFVKSLVGNFVMNTIWRVRERINFV